MKLFVTNNWNQSFLIFSAPLKRSTEKNENIKYQVETSFAMCSNFDYYINFRKTLVSNKYI